MGSDEILCLSVWGVHLIQFKVLQSSKTKLSSVFVRWVMGPQVIFSGPLQNSYVFGKAFFHLYHLHDQKNPIIGTNPIFVIIGSDACARTSEMR